MRHNGASRLRSTFKMLALVMFSILSERCMFLLSVFPSKVIPHSKMSTVLFSQSEES